MLTPREYWLWVAYYDLMADEKDSDSDDMLDPGDWAQAQMELKDGADSRH
jgi:hypothetical protein